MLSPLRIVARHGLGEPNGQQLEGPLTAPEWRRLLAAVRRHRLMGLLGAAVADGTVPVSAEQQEDVEAMEVAAAAAALRLERALLEAAKVLDRHGIDFRVLKGPAVAHLDYADPMLRHFGDIDLLVPAGSLVKASANLVSAGGARRVPELAPGFDESFGKGYTIETEGGCELDVHRTFVAGRFGLRLDPERLFDRGRSFQVAGTQLPALADEERFLHASFHSALGDRRPRLTAVRDVAQVGLNPSIDWDRVRQLVASWRCDAVVERALGQLRERLELQIVADRLQQQLDLDPSARDRRAVRAYLASDGRYARQALGAIIEVPGWRSKLAYVRALAVPDRSNLRTRDRSRLSHLLRGARHAWSQVVQK